MNFLAHLLLADDTEEGRIGSLLADFTNLPNHCLSAVYGDAIAEGVVLHRQIDTFTDAHAAVVEAAALLFSRHRHAARVIVDILFDHYLSRHWDKFCTVGRTDFIRRCHATLAGVDPCDKRLPEQFRVFALRLPQAGILAAYETVEGVGMALERVSKRISGRNTIYGALEDIGLLYLPLERCFLRFFPDLCRIVQRRGKTRLISL